ncbi:MAG: hypothetical protein GY941_28435 [Planctomycetes bacterium]|nr:hypothetical protein [Planctomycetota bacterium]
MLNRVFAITNGGYKMAVRFERFIIIAAFITLSFIFNPINRNIVSADEPDVDVADSGGSLWSQNGSGINYDGGRVGMGTSQPEAKLHIVGNEDKDAGIFLQNGLKKMGMVYDSFSKSFLLGRMDRGGGPLGAADITILDGNIGIGLGIATPHYKLDIFGGKIATGSIFLGNWDANNSYNAINLNGLKGATNYNFLSSRNSTLQDLLINRPEGHNIEFREGNRNQMVIKTGGNVIINKDLEVNGTAKVKVIEIKGADFSEKFDISKPHQLKDYIEQEYDTKIEPGMVTCIDPENPGKLLISSKAYDRTVAGIISGAGGIRTGMLMGQEGTAANGEYPVALSGRVYCKADAAHGSIKPGDLLTTSDTPGYVMKVNDYDRAHGATIGKAMSSLDEGTGLVLTLVSLQ